MNRSGLAGEPVLDARGLVFGHGRGRSRVAVGDHIDLRLVAGEIVVVLGASGCGKSSLLRVLAGLEQPWEGSVTVHGEPLARPHPRAGLLFQRPGLLPWLRCDANVGFGLGFRHHERLTRRERHARVAESLEAVGLSDAARRYPSQLSGGMAQRAALARALARDPSLLFCDEPFSALDAITRGEMQSLLRSLVRQRHAAALLVTHDVDEAIAMGDRILLLGAPAAGHASRWLGEWRGGPSDHRAAILDALRSAASRAPRTEDALVPAAVAPSSIDLRTPA